MPFSSSEESESLIAEQKKMKRRVGDKHGYPTNRKMTKESKRPKSAERRKRSQPPRPPRGYNIQGKFIGDEGEEKRRTQFPHEFTKYGANIKAEECETKKDYKS